MSASLEHATNGLEEIQLDMLANISHGVRTPSLIFSTIFLLYK